MAEIRKTHDLRKVKVLLFSNEGFVSTVIIFLLNWLCFILTRVARARNAVHIATSAARRFFLKFVIDH